MSARGSPIYGLAAAFVWLRQGDLGVLQSDSVDGMYMSERLPIVMGVDETYVWPWLVAVFSAVSNRSYDYEMPAILATDSQGLTQMSRSMMLLYAESLKAQLSILEVAPTNGAQVDGQISSAAYARLRAADLLQEPFLWLDVDLLCRQGWDELIHRNFVAPSSLVAACRDTGAHMYCTGSSVYRMLTERYINSGVMQFDPVRWRNHGMDERWPQIASDHANLGFRFHDQDVINFLVSGRGTILPGQFNCLQNSYTSGSRVAIFHFVGPQKPWRPGAVARRAAIWRRPAPQRQFWQEWMATEAAVLRHIDALGGGFRRWAKSHRQSLLQGPLADTRSLMGALRERVLQRGDSDASSTNQSL